MDAEKAAQAFVKDFELVRAEINKVIVGAEGTVDGVLTALFAGGHCLLEGVPGLGKTLLIRTLSEALDLKFSRIQFTPDLMPADIIGTNMIVEDDAGGREFSFRPGPIFANLVLADEINRATPKTQSALLEAMQEHTVSVAKTTHRLEEPFFVMATQNPIEMEGTYPLPEAQLDRFFFKLLIDYPSGSDLATILERTTAREVVKGEKAMEGAKIAKWQEVVREVPVAPEVTEYAVRLTLATQPTSEHAPPMVKDYVRFGSSPRGAQALLLAGKVYALRQGRFNVSFDDVERAATPALRHRTLLNFEAQADGISADEVIAEVVKKVVRTEKVG